MGRMLLGGDLVAIAADGTPQPQPWRVAQVAEIQVVPADLIVAVNAGRPRG
jgi:hypothetical protein